MLSLTLSLLSLALQPASTAPADAAAPTTAPAAATVPAETIKGAPTDDYGFVAWCRGALTGHMELFKQVRPEMARVEAEKAVQQDKSIKTAEARAAAKTAREKEAKASDKLDAEQLAAGRDYIGLYARALKAAEAASPTPIAPRGVEATAQGYRIWSAARAADSRTGMWSYIMWELPARCETAAKTLEANSGLLGEAFKASTSVTTPVAAPTPSATTETVEAAPAQSAPAPVVETATAAAAAPVPEAPAQAQAEASPAKAVVKPKAKASAAAKPKLPAPPPLRTSPQG